MDSDSSEFFLFFTTQMTFGHLQHQHSSSKSIGSRVRQDRVNSLISLECNCSDTRDFQLIQSSKGTLVKMLHLFWASFPLYSYAFSSLMNISLDRTDKLKELNDSAFSVTPIPNIPPSAPISELLSFQFLLFLALCGSKRAMMLSLMLSQTSIHSLTFLLSF